MLEEILINNDIVSKDKVINIIPDNDLWDEELIWFDNVNKIVKSIYRRSDLETPPKTIKPIRLKDILSEVVDRIYMR